MNLLLSLIHGSFLDKRFDLRIRLFNILAMAGVMVSFISAIVSAVMGEKLQNAVVYLVFGLLAAALLWYASKSGRYQLCYMITIVTIFLMGFPFFFFNNGGYYGTIPYFFIFALVFTAFMLEGKTAFLMVGVEMLLYIGLCLYAYFFFIPEDFYISSRNVMITAVFGFVVVGLALSIVMLLQFRLYNEQQKKLDEQNQILQRTSRAKTEFLSNTSHEMRTPLTVISVNVQTVTEILEDMGEAVKDAEAAELLQNAQQEIMRLARMVGGMLTLASMSENTDKQAVDFTSLLRSSAEMFSLHLQKKGNALATEIAGELNVFGNADLLAQVVANLLQNAAAYTEKGEITLRAEKAGHEILVTVKDTGVGISAELLPHVFERGFSTGGTGFGLYLCKTVVESHGGRIWIESRQGNGAAVMFALPTYEGQFGGDTI
ncbi:signal transduction histidine kinase [Kineothrix alysoides]|uniref:histidine kinase n=1 Tax=Kineothrix alysoides TaxID=1469948 RepID=A0A4R1R5Y1_9FIRM|nr:HAMP domain-containing sensor histidine kinase [Kineothrix alysoides]TCL60943.1 signal transduction histidine kinase [Kineothrix alysoides]